MYRICSDERKRCRRSVFPKQRYIVSPINRPYRVGWGVQPKSPDTTILRLNIMGSVPLRSFTVKHWHTTHDWGLMCVFSCV